MMANQAKRRQICWGRGVGGGDCGCFEISEAHDMSVSQKLDFLRNMVQSMGEKISSQVRLKVQEERQKSSIHDILAVSSAHSSPKGSHQKLHSIQTLREDARIQAEVEQRMQEYSDTSRNDHAGRPNTHKSGRFRADISHVKVPVSWPRD